MAKIEASLEKMGLILPEPLKVPAGVTVLFKQVLVRGNHAYIAGHAPQNPDGTIARPLGKVGQELTVEQGQHAAKLVAVSMLADLKRALGDLDRVASWLKVFGMVNVAPGFNQTTAVINGFSELILTLYGPERGAHTRSAVGMAALPLDIPVEVEAEVEIST
ncbi:MAG TPA: RidA family protein [Alphaproteobacteria bacterium]|nr:RidA family protein [Alphaproteobacteria bacterium]